MQNFTNPLENIKIASPCSANWNEMYGNERKRYCGECKLNVFNLSDMTQTEAENFLINAEGRVCIKFYRRADGTVLTQNCPVGWQNVKKKVSRRAKAFVALFAGIFGGVFAFNQFKTNEDLIILDQNNLNFSSDKINNYAVMGQIIPENYREFIIAETERQAIESKRQMKSKKRR